jgi:DNA-binding response OmpR family regulator
MNDGVQIRPTHILMVEDHSLLRQFLERLLTAEGFQVTVAQTGDQAASLLERGVVPDVLVSDIRMPGRLNGLDLARWVRERYPSMAILLLTGFTDMDTGGFHVLYKPFNPETLLAEIKQSAASITPNAMNGVSTHG